MVDSKIHLAIITRIDECLAIFEAKNGLCVARPAIEYTLSGTTAGVACITPKHSKILLNLLLLNENIDEFLNQTIPHEIAHICAYYLYHIEKKTKIQPHGREWKEIVKSFNATPSRLHTYDTSRVAQRDTIKHLFVCKCNYRHYLSPKVAKRSQQLCCTKCNSNLVFIAVGKLSKLQKMQLKSC